MQITALLPLLALLATTVDARTHHPNTRRHLTGRKAILDPNQESAVKRYMEQVERRDVLANENPRALESKPKRVVKRGGAGGCRAKNSTASATSLSASSATSATVVASSTDSSTTTSATQVYQNAVASISTSSDDSDSTTSSAAAAATSAASTTTSSSSNSGLSPQGKKSGVSAGDALSFLSTKISWWYDYFPKPNYASSDTATYVPMLWGDGHTGDQDATRLAEFKALDYHPAYIMGFYEPDCDPPMSSAMDSSSAASLWNELIVPHRTAGGSLLISPGMCKQKDETWLTPFRTAIGEDNMWDITSIHINKNSIEGAKADIDYYWNTYGKPIWVTEFACVDDANGFTPCTDQGEIDSYITQIVSLMDGDDRIKAYAYSNGQGLGTAWPMVVDGSLTASGKVYINALSG